MSFALEWLDRACRERGAALMGILNVTPDSFFDGGRFTSATAAAAQVDRLVDEGAAIIDIGAESSRPGAEPVRAAEQIDRSRAALERALARGVMVSIDTTNAEVAEHALALGARFVNDVSCLADPELAAVSARHGATLILMHTRGGLGSMRGFSEYPDAGYGDVAGEVLGEWRGARDRAVAAGLERESVWLDPGVGFAKNARQSFELLRRLDVFLGEGVPVVVGPSRKSFLSLAGGAGPGDRLGGTIAACLAAAARGAKVLRVHDVGAVSQALRVARLTNDPTIAEARHA